jgi:hypothetical protein
MKRVIAVALAAGCLVSSAPAFADDAGAFDKWLSPDAPECVPLSAIKSVAKLRDLTPEQFQFARASRFRQFRENCLPAIMRSWRVRATP